MRKFGGFSSIKPNRKKRGMFLIGVKEGSWFIKKILWVKLTLSEKLMTTFCLVVYFLILFFFFSCRKQMLIITCFYFSFS